MKTFKQILKVLLMLAIAVILLYVSLGVLISISWSGQFIGYEWLPLILYLAALISVFYVITSLIFLRNKLKKAGIAALVCCSAFGLSLLINGAYLSYQKSLIITEPEVNVSLYAPFSNNGNIASLDSEPTLALTENFPVLDGATALYPVYSAFAEAIYPKKEYLYNYGDVQCNNTVKAYKNLIDGKVNIIFAAQPSEGQIAEAASRGIELYKTPIGKEAFVFFVNKANKVNNLSFEQLKEIYSGEITNWKEVGGKNSEITAFQRVENSGSQTMFLNVMKGANIAKAPKEKTVGGMGGIIEETAQYKNSKSAVGFSFLYYATQMKNNAQIKLLSIDGIKPSEETVRNGEYPFTSMFYAITNGAPDGNEKPLIDWILSEQGQELIEKTGYVGISE
jgi:phosphate transport system substrate-binding protein